LEILFSYYNSYGLKLLRGVFNLTGIDVCELSLARLILLGFQHMDYIGLGSKHWSSLLKLTKASGRFF